jgi:hypothetical protein
MRAEIRLVRVISTTGVQEYQPREEVDKDRDSEARDERGFIAGEIPDFTLH